MRPKGLRVGPYAGSMARTARERIQGDLVSQLLFDDVVGYAGSLGIDTARSTFKRRRPRSTSRMDARSSGSIHVAAASS